jgi:hypothetical protein
MFPPLHVLSLTSVLLFSQSCEFQPSPVKCVLNSNTIVFINGGGTRFVEVHTIDVHGSPRLWGALDRRQSAGWRGDSEGIKKAVKEDFGEYALQTIPSFKAISTRFLTLGEKM